MKIKWYKFNPRAKIPSKAPNAAGYDVYTIEEDYILPPHTAHLFPTGLGCVLPEGWWMQVVDRGSTGSKNLHVHCGVIDNDYRGEIFVCINNDNQYPVRFSNRYDMGYHEENGLEFFVYPAGKAIAQLVLIPQPAVEVEQIYEEEWNRLKKTDRGAGALGSTGK